MAELQSKILQKNRDDSFRLYLQGELVRRVKLNPKYSLRAFAKALRVSPATLSHLLSGKRAITPPRLKNFADKLGLPPQELVKFSYRSRPHPRLYVQPKFNQLSIDSFQIISDWYHYAILELIGLKSFKSCPKWIAKTLNISIAEVNAAIERLLRVGLIKQSADGELQNVSGSNSNLQGGGFTDTAKRTLQKQIIEKSLAAIDQCSLDRRDHSSITLAFPSRRMQEAVEFIKRFRQEFTAEFDGDNSSDQVYQLSLAFFPLTEIK